MMGLPVRVTKPTTGSGAAVELPYLCGHFPGQCHVPLGIELCDIGCRMAKGSCAA